MSDTSPILGLPYLQPSQAQKHVTHNESLQVLDVVTQLVVEAFDADTPPTVAGDGAVYALGGSPTAAWAGHAGELAIWRSAAWDFIVPAMGWRAWGKDAGDLRVWTGAEWGLIEVETQNLEGLGIQTQSDTHNRLAVRAASTLLTHEGAGHQLKINKASGADTASLLFQSNWTGYAEMGLAGSEAFAIKVSPDGASWTEAIGFDGATGCATGAAVQSATDDATEGRLMRVGAFGLGATTPQEIADIDDAGLATGYYRTGGATANTGVLPSPNGVLDVQSWDGATCCQRWTETSTGETFTRVHNGGGWSSWARQIAQTAILGAVSENGGVPTGAIIERGTNGNGAYVRFADGTQVCHVAAPVDVTSTLSQNFAFSAAFAAAPAVSFGHVGETPNAALYLGNIQFVSGSAGSNQHWTVRLVSAGISVTPGDDAEKLSLTAIGRWF